MRTGSPPASDPALRAPFSWEDQHIAADLPGARVLFTTRRGGVSEGPYESLNLGRWTDDDPAA
ncbi:MAG TPA: laccase domain-containing protein, partial [Solirubrobacteraceae bacterium]|nr:laccase domain-containing protein [Solirubrobacteraceae bacterium]